MANAQVEPIRIYGAAPKIDPASDPETGIEILTAPTWVGVVDGPVVAGASNVIRPVAGTNRSVVAALALRVTAPGDPVTVISNVRWFLSQANINALGGAYDGCHLYTPDQDTDTDELDPFIVTAGSNQGKKLDYKQATRTLGVQGYSGDNLLSIYTGIDAVADILALPNEGLLDLTGLGREDGTAATFGTSVNDVSKMFLLQMAVTSAALRGLKPVASLTYSYEEVI